MSRQRKQQLSVKEDTTSTSSQPTVSSRYALNFSTLALSSDMDPFLVQVNDSPNKLNDSVIDLDAVTEFVPSQTYDDDFLSTFMEILDPSHRTDSFTSELLSPSRGMDSGLGNKELFQDLKYTSTPKASTPNIDSGYVADEGVSIKRQRTTSHGSYTHILHDITDSNKMNLSNETSFISLSQQLNVSNTSKEDESENAVVGKRISIIRKDLTRRVTPNVEVAQTSKAKVIDEEYKQELIYYSGIWSYTDAVGLLKHIRLPANTVLSTFKSQLMVLTKLRLDLEWRDLSFRFHVKEPIARQIFSTTVRIMAHSLMPAIPWQVSKVSNSKKNPQTLFVYPLQFTADSNKQILIYVTDSKNPVLYVSKCFSSSYLPLTAIASDSTKYGVEFVSVHDPNTGRQTNYRFIHDKRSNQIIVKESAQPAGSVFLTNCQNTIKQMFDYQMLTSDHPTLLDTDLESMVVVAGALTNINSVKSLSSNLLKQVFNRSSTIK